MGTPASTIAQLVGATNTSLNAQDDERLKNYLSGQAYKQKQATDLDTMQKLQDSGYVNEGGGAKAGEISVSKGFNTPQMATQQAQKFSGDIEKQYKDLNDRTQAIHTSLNQLDLNNAAATKVALINEAKSTGGARAMAAMVQTLQPNHSTANMTMQELENAINNTPEKDIMQGGYKDALRDSLFSQAQELSGQHQLLQKKLLGLAGTSYPMVANPEAILGAAVGPASQRLQEIDAMRQQYLKARNGAPNQTSNIAPANSNPTNLDRLRSLFTGSQTPQAAPQQAPAAPMQGTPQDAGMAPPQAPQGMPKGAVKMQRNAKTGQTRYLDAQGNVINGQ